MLLGRTRPAAVHLDGADGGGAVQGLAAAALALEAAAVAQDLAAVQGLGPAVTALTCLPEGQARPRGAGERGAARAAAPARRLRPAGVYFAVCAGEHSTAQYMVGRTQQ
ncbi:hypothetical protein CHLRE_06g251683v5 [Chlamydomonas reinhardtii]|uniref:Uncharacterized protein n=1 Tax=Chlamydomonas reinhardtii TaxID=3055 RepID=A0A2K3DM02_CHLRE|nr:uncharacterized protein CHLRE_06g251683v5 [Chlamydomonas reinhardtii]PNW81560.1 hypothetical protein CHLRE_06g251683v5 [Chlamydomonas reinhardtii]